MSEDGKVNTGSRSGTDPRRGAATSPDAHPTVRGKEVPPSCSLTQTLDLVGERWMFLIMRQALAGARRFSEFKAGMRIASDVLTARLNVLVDGGVMLRRSYREPGQRTREDYHLTDAGRELALVLGALQQWGDRHMPSDLPALRFRTEAGLRVSVQFVDDDGAVITADDVRADHVV
ncbi:winged helix-turn-helix transcriptional regulator [Micromonospora chokoriensis]